MEQIKIKHRQAQKRSMVKTEDGLTYNVFNRLSYLSARGLGEILNNAFNLRADFETLQEISFWPKWNVKNVVIVKNSSFIEPDVFLRFKEFDIIIEAKRYDINQQSEFQWKDQVLTYDYIFGVDNKELVFIALGGMTFNKAEQSLSLIQAYWFQLAQSCYNSLKRDVLKGYEKRIVNDALEILNFYNHIPLNFLETLEPINLSNQTFKL